MNSLTIRPPLRADLGAMEAIIAATGLFPPEMLAEMIAPWWDDSAPNELWRVADLGGVQALAYAAEERMTAGCWNLLLIAVHPAVQGTGVGSALMAAVEGALAALLVRILLVETSGMPDFARTRAFYAARGYAEEGRIREYYTAGDDKVIFRKALTSL